MKMHRWMEHDGTNSICHKCGLVKRVTRHDKFIRTEYLDLETGECWLRAPECSEKLVQSAILPDNQLKLDL